MGKMQCFYWLTNDNVIIICLQIYYSRLHFTFYKYKYILNFFWLSLPTLPTVKDNRKLGKRYLIR